MVPRANVPGKRPSTLCYLGGMAGYREAIALEVEAGFPGYTFSAAPVPA